MARIVDPTKVVLFLAEAETAEVKEETKEVTKQEARVPTEVDQVPLEFLAVPQVVVRLAPHRVDVVAHHRAVAAKAKPRVDEAQRKVDGAQPKEAEAQTKVDQDPTWEEAEEDREDPVTLVAGEDQTAPLWMKGEEGCRWSEETTVVVTVAVWNVVMTTWPSACAASRCQGRTAFLES